MLRGLRGMVLLLGCSGCSCQNARLDDLDDGVVIRNAARIQPSRRDDYVDLGPVGLQTTRLDAIDLQSAVELSELVAQGEGVTIAQRKPLRVFFRHNNVIASRPGYGIVLVHHHAVELFPAPCRQMEKSLWNALFGKCDGGEVTFAVRGEEFFRQQAAPAVLEIVALLSHLADA